MIEITRIRGHLNFEQIGKVKTVFRKFDKNENNSLARRELKNLLLHFDIYLSEFEIENLAKAIDEDGSGAIEFEEVVSWLPTILALKRMGQFKPPLSTRKRNADAETKENENYGKKLLPGLPPSGISASSSNRHVYTHSTKVDWKLVRSKLPFSKNDPEETAKRKDLFMRIDVNGNGYLSLAEIDKGIRDEIRLPAMFNAKPVIMRAYQSAKNASATAGSSIIATSRGNVVGTINTLRRNNNNSTSTTKINFNSHQKMSVNHRLGDDYVEASEFRLLMKYLYGYFQLWECFEQVDEDGDRRIDLSEFVAGFSHLVSWGMCLTREDPQEVFKSIDLNKGGYILFDEMAAWALKRQLLNDE